MESNITILQNLLSECNVQALLAIATIEGKVLLIKNQQAMNHFGQELILYTTENKKQPTVLYEFLAPS